MSTQLTLGSLEMVSLPELGVEGILAKVDTGAFSGALHCTDIRAERHGKEHTLYFTTLGKESLATKTSNFKEIIVRSANGQESVRFVIPVIVEHKGQNYE